MEIKFKNGSYIKSIDSKENKCTQGYRCAILPTDEEIQKEIDELELTDTITPDDVRNHIGKCLYELFCKQEVIKCQEKQKKN